MQYSTSDRQLYFRCWSSEIATPYSVHFRLDLSYHRRQGVQYTNVLLLLLLCLLGSSLSPSFSEAASRSYSSMRIMGEPPPLLVVQPILLSSRTGYLYTLYSMHFGSPTLCTLVLRTLCTLGTLVLRTLCTLGTLVLHTLCTLGTLVLHTLCTLGTLVLRH